MFRAAAKKAVSMLRGNYYPTVKTARFLSGPLGHIDESEDKFNNRYISYFLRVDIDGWDVRQAMNDLCGMDIYIDPTVVEAGLRACRQVNDVALAIRWLEAVKDKCADDVEAMYPYTLEYIKPTLSELGIPTPEELKYDKPELALESVFDM